MDRTFEAGTLMREQFIEWMYNDIVSTKMVKDALNKTAARKAWRDAKAATEQRFKDFYATKYKRQTTIDKHASEEFKMWCEKHRWMYSANEMKSIAWSIEPWNNGGCYIINIDSNLKERLGKIYDQSSNNKYFKGCTGWYIDDNDYVILKLSEELQAKWNADKKCLAESINRFYAGSNYLGD